jgi:hypothetical protein
VSALVRLRLAEPADLVPGQPALYYPRPRTRGGAVAARKQKRMSAQVVEDEDYQLRYEVAAGIDVAKDSAVVCVRMPPAAGRKHRTSHLQTVPATVPAIGELAAELVSLGVQMVSMEATSDYWRIWFAVLEEAGLAVQLVSSSQARNLPGRPKTDKDARWIARLTEMGMLRSSFVPPPEIRRAVPPPVLTPRRRRAQEGRLRRRPVHPHHRLAPAQRPRRPLPRPRPGLARPPHRPQPQGPQRPPPALGCPADPGQEIQ